MRVGLVLSLLLATAATVPAFVQSPARVQGGGSWVRKTFLGEERLEMHDNDKAEDEPRGVAIAKTRGQDFLRLTIGENDRAVVRESLADLVQQLRVFAMGENSFSSRKSKVDKGLRIAAVAHVAAHCVYGGNKGKLCVLLKPFTARALIALKKRLGGSGIVSVPGTTGHISRRPGARPTSTADPFPSQPYTDTRPSCGWFGWRTTPLVDSRGSPIVASVESQQDESARQMHGLRDDVSVDDSAAGEGGARGNYAVLLSYIHQTRDAELLWRDQTTSVRGRHLQAYAFTYWWLT